MPHPVHPFLQSGVISSFTAFCASLMKFDKDIETALKVASINSAGVVSEFGATQGLLTFDDIIQRLEQHPDFKCKIEMD